MKEQGTGNTTFQHPFRFPKNADGPFYTTGQPSKGSAQSAAQWCGNCLWCGAPEAEAPELFAAFDETYTDTYFVRQPQTPEELARAIMAAKVCCVSAVRYGGMDRNIISAMGNNPELCDYIIGPDQSLKCTVGSDGKLLAFARSIVDEENYIKQLRNHREK